MHFNLETSMINAASAMNFAPMLSVPFTGAWVSARQTDKVVTVRAKIQDREGIPRIDTIDPCWYAARGWTDDVELQHSGYVQHSVMQKLNGSCDAWERKFSELTSVASMCCALTVSQSV